MSSHKTKSIWGSSGKLIVLWLILNGSYMLLNFIGEQIATYHESVILLILITVLTFIMAIITFVWALKAQKQYSKVKFSAGRRSFWTFLGVIGSFILPMIALIPAVILKGTSGIISKNQ